MKIPRIRPHLLVILMGAALAGSPTFGQDTSNLLSQSLDFVHQVENPTGTPPTDAQRIDLLMQAIKTAQAAPNHRLQGHRVLAIQAIRGAIAEIRSGDPDHKAATYLQTADTELSTSISLAGEAGPTSATTTNPTPTTNTTAATPPSSISPEASKAMRQAAENGDLGKVKALLQEIPGLVFSKDKYGNTPLHNAAGGDHKDVVELLLANKADVHARNQSGQTPLHLANKDVAELLLANGADINARDNEGTTPLIEAAGDGTESDGNKDLAQFLLAQGADVNARDKSGCTALTWAAIEGNRDIAELLIANKADVNATSPCGQTALNSAAMNGHKDVAELLLAHHADLHARAKDGKTALDWAVNNGRLEMVEFLLAQGADVNAKANDGSTPLHLAEVAHNYDVAALLRQHGGQEPAGSVASAAPLGTGDASTDPASLQAAARAGDLQKVKTLLQGDPTLLSRKYDFDMTPLISAAANGHKDVVEFLLANHADINATDSFGETALAHAVEQDNKEMTELLLANKADVNARDKNGETPLYAAFFIWHKDMAVLLLAHGADPNIADVNGKTPLHLAAGWIRPDQAELLLAHGANVNARDKDGNTPLYVAIRAGARDDIAQVLLAHGADAAIKGHDGLTPREVAMQKGDKDMASILSNPTATLGPPPAPADGVAPPELIARFMTDIAKKPPGPVENDVTEDVMQTMEGMAQLTNTKISPRESIVTGFGIFTLEGPVSEFYAQGLAAIYEGKATLSESAAKDFQDDQSTTTWTDKGKTVTDQGPVLMFGPGAADFTDAKVPADRHVVVSFCLVQQHGRWRVHCLYFSNAPLAGDHKDFVVQQLAAFSRKQGG